MFQPSRTMSSKPTLIAGSVSHLPLTLCAVSAGVTLAGVLEEWV
jgi:hypothetical protein